MTPCIAAVIMPHEYTNSGSNQSLVMNILGSRNTPPAHTHSAIPHLFIDIITVSAKNLLLKLLWILIPQLCSLAVQW